MKIWLPTAPGAPSALTTPETQAMPPITAYCTSSTEPTTPYWPNPTFVWRNDNRTPPVAAIPAATAKAYSLTPTTLMPSDAAARSLLRTASIREPTRPRRRLAAISPTTTSTMRTKPP